VFTWCAHDLPFAVHPRSFGDDPAAAVVELQTAAPQPSTPRRARVLAAAAVVIVILAAVALVARPRPAPGPEVSVASSSLADLAATARSTPAVVLAPGQYLHTRVKSGNTATPDPVSNEQVVEAWLDATGAGLAKTTDRIARSLISPTAPTTTVGEDQSQTYQPGAQSIAGGTLTAAQLQALPTDADGLRAALLTALGPHTEAGDVAAITGLAVDVAALPTAPAGVRAAVVDLLAQEGFVGVGPRADVDGRAGAGFDLSQGDTTLEVVFDDAGVPLGRAQVVATPGAALAPTAPVGAVLRFSVYQLAEDVDRLPS
jgi:hypothetical protein